MRNHETDPLFSNEQPQLPFRARSYRLIEGQSSQDPEKIFGSSARRLEKKSELTEADDVALAAMKALKTYGKTGTPIILDCDRTGTFVTFDEEDKQTRYLLRTHTLSNLREKGYYEDSKRLEITNVLELNWNTPDNIIHRKHKSRQGFKFW